MKFRHSFASALEEYRLANDREAAEVDEAIRFLASDPTAFERGNLARHFTGSSLIVSREGTHVLLTLHRKLGKWLQLGGHCDGLRDPFFVAWKEAYEESGLKLVTPVSQSILNLSIHPIPARPDVPEHFHYDVTYLFEADMAEPLAISDESVDLAWVSLADVARFNDDQDFLRLCAKAGMTRRGI